MLLRGGLAVIIAAVMTGVVRWALLRWNVVDVPSARSSHRVVTPRGGGLAVAIAVLAVLAFAPALPESARVALVLVGMTFGAIGLREDTAGIYATRRLVLLFLAAGLALPWLLDGLGGPLLWRVCFGLGVLVWIVSYVNSFNFMDGINGLAAGQVIVAGLAWYALGVIEHLPWLEVTGLVLAGAALGFLPWNVPNARVFLGDVGSYFLGAVLASIAVLALRAGLTPEAVMAPVAVYLADTGSTLMRRVRAGKVWHEPHHEHVYQRLWDHFGESHVRTTLVVVAAMLVCAVLGQLSLAGSLVWRVAGDAGIVAALAAYVASPTVVDRLRAQEPVLA